MNSVNTIEVPPRAGALTQSMRGMGYTLQTAVADIIDNSISAGAKTICLRIDRTKEDVVQRLVISDDGCGMNRAELILAMSLGSISPSAVRCAKDLGRFGLGLKTASFSQCCRLTVVSKTEAGMFAFAWDLETLSKTDEWNLEELKDLTDLKQELSGPHGTAVIWEKLDRALGPEHANDFATTLETMKRHLSLVFHRFLEDGDFKLLLNGRPIVPWDPFFSKHPSKPRDFPTVTWPEHSTTPTVHLRPFVLPDPEFSKESIWLFGENDDLDLQVFFVYRSKRLISYGGWLGFRDLRKDVQFKLARLRIDFTNADDVKWQLDIRKSMAKPPHEVRNWLFKYAVQARTISETTLKSRNPNFMKEAASQLWLKPARGSISMPNAADPVFDTLIETLSEGSLTEELLKGYLELLAVAHPTSIKKAPTIVPDALMLNAVRHVFHMLLKQHSKDEAKALIRSRRPFDSWPAVLIDIFNETDK